MSVQRQFPLGFTSDKVVFNDHFSRADGLLGNGWIGSSWSITGGQVKTTPTKLQKLTNGDMESWASPTNLNNFTEYISGTSTINQETTDAHSGAGAVRYDFDASGSSLYIAQNFSPTQNTFLEMSGWLKSVPTGKSARFNFGGRNITLTDAYAKYHDTLWFSAAYGLALVRNVATSSSIYGDDFEANQLLLSSLFTVRHFSRATVEVGVKCTIEQGTFAGVVCCLDNPASPQNMVFAYHNALNKVTLAYLKNGVYTQLLNVTVDYSAGAVVEIRHTTPGIFKLYYQGKQMGADQNLSAESGIINNRFHGMFNTNELNRLQDFYCFNPATKETKMVAIGGSITGGAGATTNNGWFDRTPNHFLTSMQNPRFHTYTNSYVGGTPSWYGLVRLQTDVIAHAPELVIIDFAVNDADWDPVGDKTGGWAPAAEALIRRLRTALPSTKLASIVFTWPNNATFLTDQRRNARDKWLTLSAHYGLPIVRWDTWLESVMGAGYDDADVNQYLMLPGNVHPNTAGHKEAFNALAATLTRIMPNISPLPSSVYAGTADYEYAPTIRTGIDNDGETGIWATNGTTRGSSTANSTISWSGTFCSFGLDTNFSTGAGTLSWSLDGGAYTAINLSGKGVANNAVWNFARGTHTVTIRVDSGLVQINRFMSV